MPVKSGTKRAKVNSKTAERYRHPESESLMRPRSAPRPNLRRIPPKKYRSGDSPSSALDRDGQNPARERSEAHLATAESELRGANAARAGPMHESGHK